MERLFAFRALAEPSLDPQSRGQHQLQQAECSAAAKSGAGSRSGEDTKVQRFRPDDVDGAPQAAAAQRAASEAGGTRASISPS